jgi:hypothetical protein
VSVKRKNLLRRVVVQAGLMTGFGRLPAMAALTGIATAAEPESGSGDMNMDTLIAALHSIGGPVCLDAANRLEAESTNDGGFNLHLRNAGIDLQDARILANAMEKIDLATRYLMSFSASYNPDLKDAGAIVLSGAFPKSMTELGLVGCSIGDAGGNALLEWAQLAPDLRMICVEGNDFSSGLKSDFRELGQRHGSLMVVV